jgi:ankyrin repeat protein
MLLDNGAYVDARGGDYGTALTVASAHGDDKIVQVLLGQGAIVDIRGRAYHSALESASEEGHKKIV